MDSSPSVAFLLRDPVLLRIVQIGSHGGDAAVGGGATVGTALVIIFGSQSSQAGPIIAGGVAFAVALITWYATDKRQARALEAERHRHEATLDHERQMADLADLRLVLAAGLAANDACWQASSELLHTEKGSSSASAASERQNRALQDLMLATGALNMRIRGDDPLYRAFSEMSNALRGVMGAARTRDKGAFAAQNDQHTAAYARLVEMATDVIGSRLPARPH